MATPLTADLVLTGARIHTMDDQGTVATALAVRNGTIVAVGSESEIEAVTGPDTRRSDLRGRTVIPGLIDAHNHLQATGRMLQQVSLYDCRSIAEIVERVAARVATASPGEWIVGRGWDESLLSDGRHPTRHDLDPVSPGNPVVLQRVWNKLVANSAALTAAGITRDSPDPPQRERYAGSFERDAAGEPTGLFRDRAKELILAHLPEATLAEKADQVATACRAYSAVGLIAVAEPGLYPDEVRAFHEAQLRGALTVRTDMLLAAWGFGAAADEDSILPRLQAVGVQGGFGNDWLRIGGVKFMPDGGVGDRTARMFAPYLDEPDNRGQWVVDPADLTRLIGVCHDLGFSIDTHTCGDEAQEVTVIAYAAAMTANPNPRLRHRVHHAYFPTSRTLQLMARHQIPAVVSNPFITNLGESFVTSLGEERAAHAMPMRTYLDASVPLAGSSDSTVSDYNPWVGMFAATTRKTVTGRVLGDSERITAKEALWSYTRGGAWAIGRENLIGSLEVGKAADLVVLADDPLTLPVDELRDVKPLRTMAGGEWVFQRD